jgi:hypothetical protein
MVGLAVGVLVGGTVGGTTVDVVVGTGVGGTVVGVDFGRGHGQGTQAPASVATRSPKVIKRSSFMLPPVCWEEIWGLVEVLELLPSY